MYIGRMRRATSFVVFFAGSVTIGLFTYVQLMWAVWGAPTFAVQYMALFASFLLFVSAFVCLFAPIVGRILAASSILGVGVLYIPASISLVPAANTIISWCAFLILAVYFGLLAFALFFPARWRWSPAIFACCVLVSVAFAGTTYLHRWQQGTLRWPSVAQFTWLSTPDPLRVDFDWPTPCECLTPDTRKALAEHGITGVLRWSGGKFSPEESQRMVIICRSPITEAKDLPYPKRGTIIYIFDGTAWKSIPAQPDVYVAHATLQPDGMLLQGPQSFRAFNW